jgi:peptidoglycan/xylan/chitin deacetylase (PgdA/CDA1 family)
VSASSSISPLDVCITVDLEPDCPPYLWTWRGIEEGAPELLGLFAHEGIRATYFTTGDTAQKYPDAVHSLVGAGHELACHGMTHRAFPDLSDETAAWEIERSAELLREFAPVTSFRAPYLRFPNRFLPLLEASRFTLDSSQAKYKRRPAASAVPASIRRIPASMTSSVLRLPAQIRDPILRRLCSPVVLFVHPWEFVDLTKERLRWDCRFRTGRPALESLRSVIKLFKARDATFRRMDELVALSRSA